MIITDRRILLSSVLFFALFVAGVNSINTSSIKNANIGGFYYYFFTLSLILFGFTALLLYRSWVNEYSSLSLLIVSLFLASLGYFFGFLNWDPMGGKYYETDLFQLQVLFTSGATLLLYMHYELNRRATPDTGLIALVTFLFTPHTIINVYYIFTDNYSPDLERLSLVTLVLLQIGTIFVFGWIVYHGRKASLSLLSNNSEKVRKLGAMQLAGLYILFLSVAGELLEQLTPLEVLNTPLFVMAFLLIGIPYYVDPKVFLLVPINIKAMGIITREGLTMYFKPIAEEFKSEEDMSSQLFGGLIIALNSMGKEVIKSQHAVDSLNFGDRSIIVEYLDPFYFVIFANTATYFLEREMREYLTELREIQPNWDGGKTLPEEVFDKLNSKFFPILGEDVREL